MLCIFPEIGIEAFEEEPGPIVPTPFQVVCKFFQASDPLRNFRKPSCLHLVL